MARSRGRRRNARIIIGNAISDHLSRRFLATRNGAVCTGSSDADNGALPTAGPARSLIGRRSWRLQQADNLADAGGAISGERVALYYRSFRWGDMIGQRWLTFQRPDHIVEKLHKRVGVLQAGLVPR